MRGAPILLAATLAGALALTAGPSVAAADAAAARSAHASADQTAARKAARWLAGRSQGALTAGQQADVIVALRSAGATPRALRTRARRLARGGPAYATTPGGAAKVALGAAAAGMSPRSFGGVDYLARLRRGAPAPGRYGTTAFDQSLSMLALRASGRKVPRSAVSALRAARTGSAWSFTLDRRSAPDVDSTALAIVALRAAGVSSRNPVVRSGVTWLIRRRNADGGWGGTTSRVSNANSTALAARALIATGRDPGRALRTLRGLQRRSGVIAHTATSTGSPLLATAEAVPALAGVSLARGPGRRG